MNHFFLPTSCAYVLLDTLVFFLLLSPRQRSGDAAKAVLANVTYTAPTYSEAPEYTRLHSPQVSPLIAECNADDRLDDAPPLATAEACPGDAKKRIVGRMALLL